ncbi:MAG: hypothetical protein QW589_03735, partial [Candidatus Bathyarchaeia archaeon]
MKNFLKNHHIQVFAIIIAILMKILLSIHAVWSHDFIYILRISLFDKNSYIPFIFLNNIIYRLWLWLPIEHPNLDLWLINQKDFPTSFSAYTLVFMLKLPILLSDIFIGFILYKLGSLLIKKNCYGNIFFLIWLLNPYVTLNAEMAGTIELIPISFLLLSVFFFIEKKFGLSFLAFATSIFLKPLSILLLPIFFIYSIRIKKKIFLKLIFTSIFGLILYAYWVSYYGLGFLDSISYYNPLTQDFIQILLTPYASRIGLGIAFVMLYYYLFYRVCEYSMLIYESIIKAFLGLFLFYFAFAFWHPKDLLWIIPFLTLDYFLTKSNKGYFIIFLFIAFILQLILFDFTANHSLFFIRLNRKYAEFMIKFLN